MKLIGALDQGTTSTRFLLFDERASIVASHQLEHRQIYPRAGWVEHDPLEIWENTQRVMAAALEKARVPARQIQSLGITNQRETTVVWNRRTGKPYANAVVWQDTRTGDTCRRWVDEAGVDRFREQTGLPVSTYFSASKLAWLLENDPQLARDAGRGEACFGTVDSWLTWWLTGGPYRGAHVTDVTSASRTMLMDLETLDWDPEICALMGIPLEMLPEICSSSEVYGHTLAEGPFQGSIRVAGDLGDQQAATVGQTCFEPGEAKNTYGTGCFMILNTGEEIVQSTQGLLTTPVSYTHLTLPTN